MATCGESASDRVTTALTSFSGEYDTQVDHGSKWILILVLPTENALYAALEAAATDEGFVTNHCR